MSDQDEKAKRAVRCEGCRFWMREKELDKLMAIGFCRRYPQLENKLSSDWCGEWEDADEHQATITLCVTVNRGTYAQPMRKRRIIWRASYEQTDMPRMQVL